MEVVETGSIWSLRRKECATEIMQMQTDIVPQNFLCRVIQTNHIGSFETIVVIFTRPAMPKVAKGRRLSAGSMLPTAEVSQIDFKDSKALRCT